MEGRAQTIGSPLSHSLRANFRAKAKKGGGKEIDGGGGARVLAVLPTRPLRGGIMRWIGFALHLYSMGDEQPCKT